MLLVVVPKGLVFVGAKAFVEVIIGLCVVEGWDTGDHDEEDDGCGEEVNSSAVVLDLEVDFRGHIGLGSKEGF